MTTQAFKESGMTFGPYSDDHCFRIEESDTWKTIQPKVKIAEFLLLKPEKTPLSLWIIEAKQSAPRAESQPNFPAFIEEICEKFVNTLTLGIASILKRHPLAALELPLSFQRLNLTTTTFRLVLIINGHQKAWLPPLQDALRIALQTTTQTWNLGPNTVAVINHESAKQFGLISAC